MREAEKVAAKLQSERGPSAMVFEAKEVAEQGGDEQEAGPVKTESGRPEDDEPV